MNYYHLALNGLQLRLVNELMFTSKKRDREREMKLDQVHQLNIRTQISTTDTVTKCIFSQC